MFENLKSDKFTVQLFFRNLLNYSLVSSGKLKNEDMVWQIRLKILQQNELKCHFLALANPVFGIIIIWIKLMRTKVELENLVN